MASKETKKYLNQLRTLQFNIDHKLSELYRLETLTEKTTIAIKNDRVQSSAEDKLSDAVVKIVMMKDEIARIYEDYMMMRSHIIGQIESLDEIEYTKVLLLRFDECLQFDAMPDRLGMSRATVFRIYNKAMDAFECKYGREYLKK